MATKYTEDWEPKPVAKPTANSFGTNGARAAIVEYHKAVGPGTWRTKISAFMLQTKRHVLVVDPMAMGNKRVNALFEYLMRFDDTFFERVKVRTKPADLPGARGGVKQ